MEGVCKSARELSQDPDYSSFHRDTQNDVRRKEEVLKKEETIQRIRSVIKEQFALEMKLKEQELSKIDQKIHQAREMLDRLRAYILAGYYGTGEKLLPVISTIPAKKVKHEDKQITAGTENMGVADDSYGNVNSLQTELRMKISKRLTENSELKCNIDSSLELNQGQIMASGMPPAIVDELGSNRFYIKRSIIVGNVSKYIPIDRREKNDQSSHKWMVYLRGPKDKPDVSNFVKKVIFFLHPSYIPNDIVEVCKAPFQLTRRGWGEFPVRLQLHFKDARNKKVDVLHHLKLDKTYTGLQTLGAETVIDLELHRHSVLDTEIHSGVATKAVNYKQQEKSNNVSTSDLNASSTLQFRDFPNEGKFTPVVQGSPIQRESPGYKDTPTHSLSLEGADILNESTLENVSEVDLSNICSEVSSRVVSRAASPLVFEKSDIAPSLVCTADAVLGRCAEQLPLIKPGRDKGVLHFAAASFEEYKSWSFSKRRASEWQRAFQMKKELDKISNNGLKMSTKNILLWCRNSGYTPAEVNMSVHSELGTTCCPLCGKMPSDYGNGEGNVEHHWCGKCIGKNPTHDCDMLSSSSSLRNTISTKDELLRVLGSQFGKLEADGEEDGANAIDISSEIVERGNEAVNSRDTLGNVCELPASLEMDWVYDAANQIGIHLPAIFQNGCRMPLLQAMLLGSMKEFIKDLLRVSQRRSKKKTKSLDPTVITPYHVHKALKATERFNFVSSSHLSRECKLPSIESSTNT